jgi:hypothetical protein
MFSGVSTTEVIGSGSRVRTQASSPERAQRSYCNERDHLLG